MAQSFNEKIALTLETFGARQVVKDFKKVQLGLKKTGDLNEKYFGKRNKVPQYTRSLRKSADALKEHNDRVDAAKKKTRNFKMEYLGIMFAGMAVDRVMTQLFKNMIKDYKEFTKNAATPLSKSLTRLEANWKFLKFSIVEVMSGFLTSALDKIANFMNKLAKADPSKLKLLGSSLLILAGAAKLFMIGGQAMLGLEAIKTFIARRNLNRMTKATGKINKLNYALRGLAGAAGITLSISAVFDFKDLLETDENTIIKRLVSILKTSAGGALIGWSVGGPAGAAIGAAIGAGLSITINLLDIAWENDIDDKLINFFIALRKYIEEFPDRFVNLFRAQPEVEIDLKTNVMKKVDKKSLGSKLGNLFSFKPYFGENSEFDRSMDALKDTAKKNAKTAGKDAGKSMGDATKSSFNSSVLGTETKKGLMDKVSKEGTEFFTVDMKNAVSDFINDEEKGMQALLNKTQELNDELGKTINKTVSITTTGGGSDFEIESEVNTNTLD